MLSAEGKGQCRRPRPLSGCDSQAGSPKVLTRTSGCGCGALPLSPSLLPAADAVYLLGYREEPRRHMTRLAVVLRENSARVMESPGRASTDRMDCSHPWPPQPPGSFALGVSPPATTRSRDTEATAVCTKTQAEEPAWRAMPLGHARLPGKRGPGDRHVVTGS